MLTLRRFAPLCLLFLFGWMVLSVSSRTGVTFDETAHLTAGRFYWQEGDYRFQPENGNFPQRWAALPSLWLWPEPTADHAVARQTADVWWFGRELFFNSGHDTAALLLSGRAMVTLLGIALLICIWAWSRQLFGENGGLISLGFAALSPTLLAHSGLITSDIAAVLGFMLALTAWWRLFHRLTWSRVLLAGVATGLLALSKFSAVLLAPVVVCLLLLRLLRRAELPWQWRSTRGRFCRLARLPALLGATFLALGLTMCLIWAAYGFRFSASTDAEAHFAESWAEVLMEGKPTLDDPTAPNDPTVYQPGIVQRFVRSARDFHLLPEAFLYGLTFTDYHARARLAYFAGDYRMRGWREFFPTAFLLKTTLPTLVAMVLALFLFAGTKGRTRLRWFYRLSPWLLFFFIYWSFAIGSSLNIGHRHLLPVYPLVFILIGALGVGAKFRRAGLWLGATVVLLAWQAIESWRVRPHYLTYFNALAGGPTGGHRYFVDSSLDWGQGLPELKTWLDAHRGSNQVFLSYFGSDEPKRFDLNTTRIGDLYFDYGRRPVLPKLTAGLYCISATMLHRVYTLVRGPWTQDQETVYQWLAQKIVTQGLVRLAPDEVQAFTQLRFGRLCHFLEQRRPDAIVGNVFFIYRLSEHDLDSALSQPMP